MRIEYNELMEKLGVGHLLSPYETRPWFLHDKEMGIMCSAEIRAGPGLSDIEAEIQFLYDEDKGRIIEKDDEEGDEEDDDDEKSSNSKDNKKEKKKPKHGPIMGHDGPEQIMVMRFLPNKENLWQGTLLAVRGETYNEKISNWDERGCAFFLDFIAAVQMSELPDVDELIEEHLVDKKRYGRGKRGRIGKKGLKVAQKGITMGMKN